MCQGDPRPSPWRNNSLRTQQRNVLLELRMIESKIEQRKLLGIKTSMTYDAIYRGRDRSKKHRSRDHSNSVIKSCKYCGKSHNIIEAIVLHLEKMPEVQQGQ